MSMKRLETYFTWGGGGKMSGMSIWSTFNSLLRDLGIRKVYAKFDLEIKKKQAGENEHKHVDKTSPSHILFAAAANVSNDGDNAIDLYQELLGQKVFNIEQGDKWVKFFDVYDQFNKTPLMYFYESASQIKDPAVAVELIEWMEAKIRNLYVEIAKNKGGDSRSVTDASRNASELIEMARSKCTLSVAVQKAYEENLGTNLRIMENTNFGIDLALVETGVKEYLALSAGAGFKGYDLSLMAVSESEVKDIKSLADKFNNRKEALPILVKRGNQIWIYGKKEDGTRDFTELKNLEGSFLSKFPEVGALEVLLKSSEVPSSVFQEIILNKGHTQKVCEVLKNKILSAIKPGDYGRVFNELPVIGFLQSVRNCLSSFAEVMRKIYVNKLPRSSDDELDRYKKSFSRAIKLLTNQVISTVLKELQIKKVSTKEKNAIASAFVEEMLGAMLYPKLVAMLPSNLMAYACADEFQKDVNKWFCSMQQEGCFVDETNIAALDKKFAETMSKGSVSTGDLSTSLPLPPTSTSTAIGGSSAGAKSTSPAVVKGALFNISASSATADVSSTKVGNDASSTNAYVAPVGITKEH